MDLWVTKGISPPPSRYPTARDRTLVSPKRNNFPKISDVRFAALHNRQLFLDYGPHIRRGKMKIHPPQPANKGEYHILVPKVDEDGNDVAGIRLPAVRVPVGTFTG
jgi:Alpha/beta hydrolase domain